MVKININKEAGLAVKFVSESSECELAKFASEHSRFGAKLGDSFYLPKEDGDSLLLLGLGAEKDLELDDFRVLGFNLAKLAEEHKEPEVKVSLPELNSELDSELESALELDAKAVFSAFVEGLIQSEYKFDKHSKPEAVAELTVNIQTDIAETGELIERVRNLMDGVFAARDLTNLTSNEMHPQDLADFCLKELEPLGIKVTVFDEKQMLELGLQAAYAVGKGSDFRPLFVVLEYNGDPDSQERTALVGKAICYDSGGYSLKTNKGMYDMHSDMGGAATVIGTFLALAKNKVKANVIGTFAPVENLVSGTSYRVGDIIGSMSGQTIEVGNTDAEGRVTLADAIYYATSQENVTRVIDIATLTGACISALGEEFTGAITNNQEFFELFQDSAAEMGEKVWQLPTAKVFRDANKSSVADVSNLAKGGAGTVTAGLFIGEFLKDKSTPWIHLDVAGTAYRTKAQGYLPERATGYHVKAFYNLLSK